jgi:hypothetical protein
MTMILKPIWHPSTVAEGAYLDPWVPI